MVEEAAAAGSSNSTNNEWMTSIEDGLQKEIQGHAKPAQDPPHRTIFRVSKRMKDRLDGKDTTCYSPEGISLGLFYRPQGRYDPPQKGEDFKLQMAGAFLTSMYTSQGSQIQTSAQLPDSESAGRSEERWKNLCHRVVGEIELKEIMDCYDLQEDDRIKDDEPREALQYSLTLDAIVVGCLFGAISCQDDHDDFPFPLIKDCVDKQGVYGGIPVEDFIKLENQIPLRLPQKVLNVVYLSDTPKANRILNGACARLALDFADYLPGYDQRYHHPYILRLKEEGKFLECDHLLGCVALVLRWDEERAGARPSTPKGFRIPSATLLREAGIKLRGRSVTGGSGLDLLPVFKQGWLEATLYIPRLPILPSVTWTLWRNIVAYECKRNPTKKGERKQDKEDHHQESQLHAFLALMDCLVDTKQDVLLLTQGEKPVLPEGYHSTKEDLAKMLKTILTGQPFVDYERWMALADQINNYHKQKFRKTILDFLRSNFGKPWLVISGVGAFVFLILTFLQTFYAMVDYYHPL